MLRSLLYRAQGASKSGDGPPDHARLIVLAGCACALALFATISLLFLQARSGPEPVGPSPAKLHPYIASPKGNRQPSTRTPHKREAPTTRPRELTSPSPPVRSKGPPSPELLARRELFLHESERPGDPARVPHGQGAHADAQPDMERGFSDEALLAQGEIKLGPRGWMAELPEEQAGVIERVIDEERARSALALDEQERESLLYDHLRFLVGVTARGCMPHDAPLDARCVVKIGRASVTQRQGILRAVSSSANVAAGSRETSTCLDRALESKRFTLEIEDTTLSHISVLVGE